MRIDIGVSVRTSDGHQLGKVEGVILNPKTHEVDCLVVHKGHILTRDVVVPLSLIQEADEKGILLRIGRDRVKDLSDFIELHYAKPSDKALTLPYAPGSMLVPLVPPYGVAGVPAPYETVEEERHVPAQDVEMTEGTQVRTVEGPIGHVEEIRTDPITDQATVIVVKRAEGREGHVEIPIEFVGEVREDYLQLTLTNQQVEQLPEPTADRYLTSEAPKKRRGRR